MIIDPQDRNARLVRRFSGQPWIDLLPKLRDLAIAGAGMVYIIGYIVWAFYASINGLGTRPAAQMQYFVAGTPALLVLAAVLLLFYWAPIVFVAFSRYLQRKFKHAYVAILLVLFLLVAALQFISYDLIFGVLAAIALVVIQCLMLALQGARRSIRFLMLPLIVVGVAFVYFYAAYIYPRIPQEFGGGRPRCVMLSTSVGALKGDSWNKLVVESRISGLYSLGKIKRQTDSIKKLRAYGEKELKLMLSHQEGADALLAETGPLLLWSESDTHLLLSVQEYGSDLEDRYIVPRVDSMVIRYVSGISGNIEGCPSTN
jgi:hypothetical protein